jgi:hypothetical protein
MATSCTSPTSAYTCRYAAQDQDGLCLPNSRGVPLEYVSCPASRPAVGGACIPGVRCAYGDVSCACSSLSRTWSCESTTPPDPCPASQPAPGAACSVRISTCAYGSRICACDGTSWSCA